MTVFHSHHPATADDSLSNWTPPETTRVHTGTQVLMGGAGAGASFSREHARYAHTINGQAGDSVLSTLGRLGISDTVELIPGNPASRTDVGTAIRMGVIRTRAGGGYEETPNAAQAAGEALSEAPQEVPQEDPGKDTFAPLEDQAYATLIDPLPQHAYDSAQAAMVAAVAHGHGSVEGVAQSLAATAGLEPAQALEMVQAAHGYYSRTVARVLAPMGLEGDKLEAAYEFMQSQPAKLQDAIQQLTHGRDVAGFKALAVDFKAQSHGAMLPLLHARGYQTHVDRTTGDLMVQKGGSAWVNASKMMGE